MLGTFTSALSSVDNPFDLTLEQRLRHTWIVGGTGTGKTTLLHNLMVADLEAGHGFTFLDPHGDRAHDFLNYIPPHRVHDVVFFSLRDTDYPITWNPLHNIPRPARGLVAEQLVDALKSIWRDSWGERMQRIFYHGFLVQLDLPAHASFYALWRMLGHKGYRQRCLSHTKNPIAKRFWLSDFPSWSKSTQVEAMTPPLNRLDQLLGPDAIRNILGQTSNKITLRELMDGKKILIVDLASGIVGSNTADLIGSILVSQLIAAALSRADIKDEARRAFFGLHVDESKRFRTNAFDRGLSEVRKYGMGISLVEQFTAQSDTLLDALLGNNANLFCFRVGPKDADLFASTLDVPAEQLMRIDTGVARVKRETDPPRWVQLEYLQGTRYGLAEDVKAASRAQYARPKQEVSNQIANFFAQTYKETKG